MIKLNMNYTQVKINRYKVGVSFWTTAACLLSYICVLNTVELMSRSWSLITVIRCGLGLTSRWREQGETQLWVFTVGAGWLVGGKCRGWLFKIKSFVHTCRLSGPVYPTYSTWEYMGNCYCTWLDSFVHFTAWTLHPHSNKQTTRQHWEQFKVAAGRAFTFLWSQWGCLSRSAAFGMNQLLCSVWSDCDLW